MALAKSKVNELPGNAVVLTEKQAVKFQSQLVNKWDNSSDVFALRYGVYFLGGAAFLSGLFINNHFRIKFKLADYGRFSSYLPMCLMPATTAMLLHTEMVLTDVMLMKGDCPVCLELRSAAYQSMLGVVFPLVVAPFGCAAIAQRYATINLPYITEKPLEVFNVVKKMFKPVRTHIWYLFLAQAFLGSAVTYFENKSIVKMQEKLALDEKKAQYYS